MEGSELSCAGLGRKGLGPCGLGGHVAWGYTVSPASQGGRGGLGWRCQPSGLGWEVEDGVPLGGNIPQAVLSVLGPTAGCPRLSLCTGHSVRLPRLWPWVHVAGLSLQWPPCHSLGHPLCPWNLCGRFVLHWATRPFQHPALRPQRMCAGPLTASSPTGTAFT